MLRSQAKVLAVAVAAVTLSVAGCNRTAGNPPPSVGIRSVGVVAAKVAAQPPADESLEKSSAPGQPGDLMDKPADTSPTAVALVHDDSAISAKVSSALALDVSLKLADIRVDTKDGLVTLSGNVDTPSLRVRAKEIAAQQQGVVDVIDNMAVASHG